MESGNTTVYCNLLDEGMISILLQKYFLPLKLVNKEESFELCTLEKVHEGNSEIFHSILESRQGKTKTKIIEFLQAGKSYLIFGTKVMDRKKIGEKLYIEKSKDVVLLYSPKLTFLPGIYYTRERKIFNKRAL